MPIDRRLHVQTSLSHFFFSPRVQMYVKRFYREDGAERKREHRQRRATTELLSNFVQTLSDLIDDEDVTDSSMNTCPAETNFVQLTAIDNGHSDTLCRSDDPPEISDPEEDEADRADDGSDNDDDDHLDEWLNSFDTNRDRKVYPSCALSIYEACLELIKISRDLNLNKLQMNRLLNGIRLLLPSDSKLPRTVPGLLKVASE